MSPRRPSICQGDGLTAQPDLALIRSQNSAQYVDQCAFACSILSDKRMNAAAAQGEVRILERDHARERFADMNQFDQRTHEPPLPFDQKSCLMLPDDTTVYARSRASEQAAPHQRQQSENMATAPITEEPETLARTLRPRADAHMIEIAEPQLVDRKPTAAYVAVDFV